MKGANGELLWMPVDESKSEFGTADTVGGGTGEGGGSSGTGGTLSFGIRVGGDFGISGVDSSFFSSATTAGGSAGTGNFPTSPSHQDFKACTSSV